MTSKPVDLPADLASAYLALLSEREMLQAERDVVVAERDTVVAERDIAVAQAANAQAMLSDSEALIAKLELAIEKLRRELRGKRSERTARLIDQMELQLEELVMAATEDEVAAQAAAAKTASVRSFTRKRPVRKPWPEDIERERVVIDPPATCACCGGSRLSKLGEDVTETLEEVPRRFKVIETVREKFSCRDCEKISQERGADRAAIMLSVITTCRLNDVDPKAWLADVFSRIADLPVSRLHELLPWQWKTHKGTAIATAA